MAIGIVVGALGYRSSYAAVFDFRYNHIPLPPFGARMRFGYGLEAPLVRFKTVACGDISDQAHPVMWSWWTKSGAGVLEQERASSWQKIVGCVGENRLESMTSALQTLQMCNDEHAVEVNDQSKIGQ